MFESGFSQLDSKIPCDTMPNALIRMFTYILQLTRCANKYVNQITLKNSYKQNIKNLKLDLD